MRKNTLPAFPSSANILPINKEVSTNIHQLYVVPTQKPTPNTHRLREGELILYKRERSDVWQARFKLFDRKWHSISTKHHNLEFASRAACEIYDEARFRERMGVSYTRRKFDAIAKETLKELQDEIDAGIKAMTNKDYIRVINKYLLPFFGKRFIENIKAEHMREYEIWRNTLMKRTPLASTLATHSSAYNRIISLAVQRGYISAQVPLAHLSRRGAKGKSRPAFSRAELDYLLNFLKDYSLGGHSALAKEMRLLSRDYIELLISTGMRSGKESLNIHWKHIEWYVDHKTEKRYLRIWVSGKTGARYLIAKHYAEEALQRLANREKVFAGLTLDEVLRKKYNIPLFRLSDGTQPKSFHTTFIWLMKASGLLKDTATGQNRTLYSLRHTYATMALIEGNMDVHTLAKQMGTSVGMLERHYSKMTAKELRKRLKVFGMSARKSSIENFEEIGSALLKRYRLQITYYARGTDKTTEREISPQRLIFYRDNWYLDAYCHLRKGLRSFSVDCITKAIITNTKADEISEKQLHEHFAESYGIFSGKADQRAKLKFSPEKARWVSAETWHGQQVGSFDKEGNYLLEFDYNQDPELVMDILKYGSGVEVLAPASLRKRVKEELAKALKNY